MNIKQRTNRNSRTYSALHPQNERLSQHLNQSSSIRLHKSKQNQSYRSNINMRNEDKSFCDSEDSDSSCMEKKYYRCGCLNHRNGCGSRYHDYLGELREERLRRTKNRLLSQMIQEKLQKRVPNGQSENDDGDYKIQYLKTPQKQPKLQQIIQISQSAEYSQQKSKNQSIMVTIGKKKYLKTLNSKQQALECLTLIEKLIAYPSVWSTL